MSHVSSPLTSLPLGLLLGRLSFFPASMNRSWAAIWMPSGPLGTDAPAVGLRRPACSPTSGPLRSDLARARPRRRSRSSKTFFGNRRGTHTCTVQRQHQAGLFRTTTSHVRHTAGWSDAACGRRLQRPRPPTPRTGPKNARPSARNEHARHDHAEDQQRLVRPVGPGEQEPRCDGRRRSPQPRRCRSTPTTTASLFTNGTIGVRRPRTPCTRTARRRPPAPPASAPTSGTSARRPSGVTPSSQ